MTHKIDRNDISNTVMAAWIRATVWREVERHRHEREFGSYRVEPSCCVWKDNYRTMSAVTFTFKTGGAATAVYNWIAALQSDVDSDDRAVSIYPVGQDMIVRVSGRSAVALFERCEGADPVATPAMYDEIVVAADMVGETHDDLVEAVRRGAALIRDAEDRCGYVGCDDCY